MSQIFIFFPFSEFMHGRLHGVFSHVFTVKLGLIFLKMPFHDVACTRLLTCEGRNGEGGDAGELGGMEWRRPAVRVAGEQTFPLPMTRDDIVREAVLAIRRARADGAGPPPLLPSLPAPPPRSCSGSLSLGRLMQDVERGSLVTKQPCVLRSKKGYIDLSFGLAIMFMSHPYLYPNSNAKPCKFTGSS